ncbi:MAG: ACT domain-containing protein [Clostridiales bacterium]|nr:ACT domain-containing protein [Clostridiales bacterium]
MKIAFLGPEGSYSHLAARSFLKVEESAETTGQGWDECIPFRNFPEVFQAVKSGRVDAAAVPIENSLQGGVLQNLDLLQSSEDLYAVKELVVRVDHRLVYKEGVKFSEIGRVYSHRQALDQCAGFLSREMPFASLRETESTAFGVARAMEDETGKSAAIAGAHTENLRSGFVLGETSISDEPNNFTHFLLIKKGKEKLPAHGNRVFFSAVCPHRPGSLLELLQIIAKYGINMTKIESRPVKNKVGDYRFFIEADCDLGSEQVQETFAAIQKDTLEWKLLGAYTHIQ